MMGILMLMNIVAGRLAGKTGARVLATAGLSIAAAGYLAMWPALAAPSHGWLALPMLLAGSGIALTIPTITAALLAAVSSAQSGTASGLLNAARQVGGVLGVAVFGFSRSRHGTGIIRARPRARADCLARVAGDQCLNGLAKHGRGSGARRAIRAPLVIRCRSLARCLPA
ncbi:MFS transporter [Burkholderia sp. IMCC1007]|uniref:MFS transporter n=1 Tax=Burkholderia sp. IMCC1007 TaxID=3004104 RepID=UPI0022B3A7F5|nr:MFS transporter [Burkholderia sp. IMCC1007]